MSILVLQSSWWGRESWLLCLICLPGVWWWLSGSSSRCHGVVCSLWLWYFLIILTYYFSWCGWQWQDTLWVTTPRDAEVYSFRGRLQHLRGWHTKTIKKSETWKSSWPDRLKPILLKELCKELVPIIQVIFERSIQTGKLPAEWCRAQVRLMFKKGDKTLAANYRLISLARSLNI